MKTPEHTHLIFVRPPGSLVWTLHMRKGVPWRDSRAKQANSEASSIVEHSGNCAVVVAVALPREKDNVLYALFADQDTLYKPSEPFLTSLKTGRNVK